ncbi:uncharacterized protein LOC113305611 [Papaver somniferum]|uniref:uncharacterized protein LOC113305611 n=1 Tax=Papaver somniferum TaxID=3469 RepID=UPI000E6FA4D3|nr:uncharacterized protein LOC113305611 [Papaver somniferum]
MSRHDLSFAVNYVPQFMHQPTDVHLQLEKRIPRYVKGSLGFGIKFTQGDSYVLSAYSDSDWDGCPDTRKSTSCYCVFMGPNLVAWSSKKQPKISRSSTEAEYKALSLTATEVQWVYYVLNELSFHGAMSLAANPVFHATTKHIEIDFHTIRDLMAL